MPKTHLLKPESLFVGSSATTALRNALTRDLEAQKSAAEIALNKARVIDEALKHSERVDPLVKEARDALLKVAQLLAQNTTNTSTTVLNIVSSGQTEPNERN
jgi:hypothetical protein